MPIKASTGTSPVQQTVSVSALGSLGGADGAEVFTAAPRAMRLELVTDATITPDNITSFAAAGGKVWLRDQTYGTEAAARCSTWYVRAAGDDNADGLTPSTALRSIEEVFARLGDRPVDGWTTGTVTIDAPDDDATAHSLVFNAINGAILFIRGKRTDTSASLTLSAAIAWSGAGATPAEGAITVAGQTWTKGTLLRVVSTGGAADGGAFVIGKDLGSGRARVSGGTITGDPAAGWIVRTYRPTRWSGFGYSFTVRGDGYIALYDFDIGPSGGEGSVVVRESGEGVVFTDCIVRGLYTLTPSAHVNMLGGALIVGFVSGGDFLAQGVTYYGSPWNLSIASTLVLFTGHSLVFDHGLQIGTLGPRPSTVWVQGLLSICDYDGPTVLDFGSNIEIDTNARLWHRDSAGSPYGVQIEAGCRIDARTTAQLPLVTGTAPTTAAYLVGGITKTQTQTDATTAAAPLVGGGATIAVKG